MDVAPPDGAIAVFTGKRRQDILRRGGSASWVLNPQNAGRQKYLVCVRNARSSDLDAKEPHHSGFLVGEIKDLTHVGHDRRGQKRWQINLKTYAEADLPGLWKE